MSELNLYEYYLVKAPTDETQKSITDIPASFHRTNPFPLDLSSALSIPDETKITDTIRAARAHTSSYTGHVFTVEKNGRVHSFVLHPKDHVVKTARIANKDKNLPLEQYAAIEQVDLELPAEEVAYKSQVNRLLVAEQSNRLKADLLEETRASNAEAAMVGGASYYRSGEFEDYSWSSGTRTLSYRGAVVSTSATVQLKDDADIQLTVDEDQLCYPLDSDIPEYDPDPSTNIPAHALYLVAKQISEDESKVSFAEFTFIPGARIPVNELALLGQSFENTYYIFDTLNYLTTAGDLDYNSQLGTVTTAVITSDQDQDSGWWLTEGGTDRVVSSLIDIEDALTTAYNRLVTVDAAETMDADGTLTINLDTLLTSKLSSFKS